MRALYVFLPERWARWNDYADPGLAVIIQPMSRELYRGASLPTETIRYIEGRLYCLVTFTRLGFFPTGSLTESLSRLS